MMAKKRKLAPVFLFPTLNSADAKAYAQAARKLVAQGVSPGAAVALLAEDYVERCIDADMPDEVCRAHLRQMERAIGRWITVYSDPSTLDPAFVERYRWHERPQTAQAPAGSNKKPGSSGRRASPGSAA